VCPDGINSGELKWEEMQHDISRDHEFVAVMIAGTVHKQQDELPGIFLAEGVQKNLESISGRGMRGFARQP
jgi:hypothetical protein